MLSGNSGYYHGSAACLIRDDRTPGGRARKTFHPGKNSTPVFLLGRAVTALGPSNQFARCQAHGERAGTMNGDLPDPRMGNHPPRRLGITLRLSNSK